MKKTTLIITCFLLLPVKGLFSQTEIVIDPNTRYQTVEGWGTSLAWWANIVGGWPEAVQDTIVKWVTDPNGLNMNVFRYNIGGGDAPDHNHFRNDGGAVPGFKASNSANYDWNSDANQRSILLKLKAARTDAVFEAFSCSPPYWMTNSGCSGGSATGGNNLKSTYYDDFADYLTEVVKYYRNNYGVTFSTLEPMNEPIQTWWIANQSYGQEGCHYDLSYQQKLIREVYKKLNSKGMLGYCTIAGNDESDIDDCVTAMNNYISAGDIMSKLTKINTHTYSGSQRSDLFNLSVQQNKKLWQSESGPLYLPVSGYDALLTVAQRIVTDMRDLKPTAWIDWQVAGWSYDWSQINLDYSAQSASKLKQLYVRMQFSRFIKKNYQIISSDESNTLAALNNGGTELVLVIVNENSYAKGYIADLNLFLGITANAKIYRTTATENCAKLNNITPVNNRISYTAPAKSVTTIIVPVSLNTAILANGLYKIKAKHSQKIMSVEGWSANNGAVIEQWSDLNQSNQKFYLNYSNGFYTVSPQYNSKVFSVDGNSDANGRLLKQWDYWGGSSQQFSIIPVSQGQYRIVAKHCAKCMAVDGWSYNNGADVVQWECLGTDNFIWEFVYIQSTKSTAPDIPSIQQFPVSVQPSLFDKSLQIVVPVSDDEIYSYKMINSQGVLISMDVIHNSETIISTGNLSPGIYFVLVQDSKNKHKVFKVLKN